jgi:hypothetical protein
MSLSTEQAAFLLDACKLIQYATEQGFKVTGGELVPHTRTASYLRQNRAFQDHEIHPLKTLRH